MSEAFERYQRQIKELELRSEAFETVLERILAVASKQRESNALTTHRVKSLTQALSTLSTAHEIDRFGAEMEKYFQAALASTPGPTSAHDDGNSRLALELFDTVISGIFLIADDTDPFIEKLKAWRPTMFASVSEEELFILSNQLLSFFIAKNHAINVAETERQELKKTIKFLAVSMHSLIGSGDAVDGMLDRLVKGIGEVETIEDMHRLQATLLTEAADLKSKSETMHKQIRAAKALLGSARQRIVALEHNLKQAKEEKSIDALTQLYNRGYFDSVISTAFQGAADHKEDLSLLMLDIDHFKGFNDSYGHQVGDKVLKNVARLLMESVRASDTCARYGGEEMVVILYQTNRLDALKIAENIRAAIGEHEFVYKGSILHVNVSIGVADRTEVPSAEELIHRADERLYIAKSEGRNRVM